MNKLVRMNMPGHDLHNLLGRVIAKRSMDLSLLVVFFKGNELITSYVCYRSVGISLEEFLKMGKK